MGEPVVELGDRELERIGQYVRRHLKEWSCEQDVELRPAKELELLERVVRVEEGLKNIAELMRQGFEQMEKRFEQVDKRFEQMEKRFEQVDKRFEDIQYNMDKRFEQVDKRFSQIQWVMGIGFTLLAALMGIFNFF
ncbi:MAG: hypothetical protein ACLFRY_07900 [Spirochaetia bacterium]